MPPIPMWMEWHLRPAASKDFFASAALRLGEPQPLHAGEIDARTDLFNPNTAEMWRAWEYWARRAGVAGLLGEPPQAAKAKR